MGLRWGVAGEVADAPVKVESGLGDEGVGDGVLSRGEQGSRREVEARWSRFERVEEHQEELLEGWHWA